MKKAELLVFYDGPALASGEMNVRDLAPALLSLGKLFEESNRVLNKGRAELYVNIKSFHGGSFGIDLSVIQSLKEQLVEFFSGETITAAANFLTLLGFASAGTAKGLAWLLKKERGRKPLKAVVLEDGNIKLIYDNDEIFPIHPDVFALYKDLEVRKAFEDSLAPLKKEGIHKFYSLIDNQRPLEISKEELVCFQTPQFKDEVLHEFEEVKLFSIISLSFKEDNKWRLNDGQSTVYVNILDKNFLSLVNSGKLKFAKGDMLKIRLRTRQINTSEGLKTEYEAIQILKHIPGSRQLSLPISSGEPEL
jgi:hypothetical protein